jgi:hypothetical protein
VIHSCAPGTGREKRTPSRRVMLLCDGGGGRALGFDGWCLILDFVMCSKGVPAALVGCSVGVEGVPDC